MSRIPINEASIIIEEKKYPNALLRRYCQNIKYQLSNPYRGSILQPKCARLLK